MIVTSCAAWMRRQLTSRQLRAFLERWKCGFVPTSSTLYGMEPNMRLSEDGAMNFTFIGMTRELMYHRYVNLFFFFFSCGFARTDFGINSLWKKWIWKRTWWNLELWGTWDYNWLKSERWFRRATWVRECESEIGRAKVCSVFFFHLLLILHLSTFNKLMKTVCSMSMRWTKENWLREGIMGILGALIHMFLVVLV